MAGEALSRTSAAWGLAKQSPFNLIIGIHQQKIKEVIFMSTTIKRSEEHIRPYGDNVSVRLKKTGNVFEIRYMTADVQPQILKQDKNHYIVLSTGEQKEFKSSTTNRGENIKTIRKSMSQLRDILNANVTKPENCRWVTLTYKENITDSKQVYHDFRRFWMRFKYYLKKQNFPSAEYIAVIEPQTRKAWHLHIVFIFSKKAPFISNEKLANIWRKGFTKITSLKNVDNVGIYLTAYFSSIPVEEVIADPSTSITGKIVEVETKDKSGKNISKAIIKGGRLKYYPKNIRFYRTSQGIKRPEIQLCSEGKAQKIIGSAPLTYEKTICVQEGEKIVNTINYRQYNKVPLKKSFINQDFSTDNHG